MNKEKLKPKIQFSLKNHFSSLFFLRFGFHFLSKAPKCTLSYRSFAFRQIHEMGDLHFFKKFNESKQVKWNSYQGIFQFQGSQRFAFEKPLWVLFSSKKEKIQKSTKYILQKYQRSNQDTLIFQRPFVREGEWVQSGDILADCSTSFGGELCLGKNIFVAYMPWEGYNYEDAILISQRLVTEDVYTSIHIESYEVETRMTKFGKEQITKKIPEVPENQLFHLDERGIVKRGTSVKEGDILVGKVTPIQKKFVSAYEKLLYTILEKELIPMRDSSLRTPKGLKAKVLEVKIFQFSNENTVVLSKNKKYRRFDFSDKKIFKNPFLKKKTVHFIQNQDFEYSFSPLRREKEKLQKESDSFSSETKKNAFFKNILKYMKKNNKKNFSFFMPFFSKNKKILKKKKHLFSFFTSTSAKLESNFVFSPYWDGKTAKGILLPQGNSELRSSVKGGSHKKQEGESLAAYNNSVLFENVKSFSKIKLQSNFQNEKKNFFLYLKKSKGSKSKKIQIDQINKKTNYQKPEKVQVYLVEKRKIQVGDKMSGRHGNKGIVSQILPIPDMPFLPDGTPLDMVLNPLGVPSRMNVGQIYECILGLASKYLQQYYRIQPFDEIYGPQASRSFTFSKLYEARQKTSQKWLFNPCYPGKIQIFDGRTGEVYENPVTVGISYILKLVHLVDDKIHARSTGPYSLVTQQPLKGRSKYGGQRLGEMEVWAIEAYGAAFVLLEMLTIKSDDISGRMTLWSNILLNMPIYIGTPESFKVLVCELQALCLDLGLYKLNKKGFLTQIEHLMQLP